MLTDGISRSEGDAVWREISTVLWYSIGWVAESAGLPRQDFTFADRCVVLLSYPGKDSVKKEVGLDRIVVLGWV